MLKSLALDKRSILFIGELGRKKKSFITSTPGVNVINLLSA
jgi:hypothetical protein